MKISPRESVIHADNFDAMVAWQQNVLGFKVSQLYEKD